VQRLAGAYHRLARRPDAGADPWTAWCDAAEDLLRWLI